MPHTSGDFPDLARLRGVVAPEILTAVEVASLQRGEAERLRPAVENPAISERIPIVPLTALVYMKLKASRQKDLADLVELLKRGKIEIAVLDQYLSEHAPAYVQKWERLKEQALSEA